MEHQLEEILGVSAAAVAAIPRVQEIKESEFTPPPLDECPLDRTVLTRLAGLVRMTSEALNTVEAESTRFQNDIRALANEMRLLQSQSSQLHDQMESGTQAYAALAPHAQRLLVPPAIVKLICERPLDAQFRAALQFVLASGRENTETSLGSFPHLHKMILGQAAVRIKEFYLRCLRLLRQPIANVQPVQEELVMAAPLCTFLGEFHPPLMFALRSAYTHTIKWYYSMLLAKYLRNIGRARLAQTDKKVTVAGAFGSQQGLLYTPAAAAKGQLFVVGSRPSILLETPSAITLADTPPLNGYTLETLVVSVLLALEESVGIESRVLVSMGDDTPNQSLETIFQDHLAHAATIVDHWAGGCGDLFGLLISLELVSRALKRGLPESLDKWLQARKAVLLQTVLEALDRNIKSIEALSVKASGRRASDSQAAPHALTQIFSNLLSGLLQISSCSQENEPSLAKVLRELSGVYEAHITKTSKLERNPEFFLYNNFFLVSALLQDVQGPLAVEVAAHYSALTSVYTP